MVEHDILEPHPAELRHRIERRSVEGDVRNEGEGRIALQQAGDRADVHDPVRRRVEDHDADRLPADEGFQLLPRRRDENIGVVGEDVLDVGEEPRGQERSDAQ